MRRCLAASFLLGGCAFDPTGLVGASPDARSADGATIDADVAPPLDAERPDAEVPDGEPPPPPCPLDDDLVACYRFEDDVTPAQPHDDSAFGNHGTSSAVTFITGRPGRGRAMQLGNTSSVLVPDSASLDVATAMTLEAWVLVTAYPTTGNRMGLLDDDGQYGLFLLPAGAVRCTIAPGSSDRLSVPLGTWTHVACTYDGAAMVMYEDGVAAAPQAMTGAIATAGTAGLGLGQNLPTGDHLAGALDDVRIWRVALTAPEVLIEATDP